MTDGLSADDLISVNVIGANMAMAEQYRWVPHGQWSISRTFRNHRRIITVLHAPIVNGLDRITPAISEADSLAVAMSSRCDNDASLSANSRGDVSAQAATGQI